MPLTTYDKTRYPRSIVYDGFDNYDFDTITVAASQANTVIQAFLPLPVACKFYGVSIVGNAAIAGLTSFNVVMGSVAEGSTTALITALTDNSEAGYPPTQFAVNGNALFVPDQAVTLAAFVPQQFATTVPDAIWPKGACLTLRIVSTAGGAGNIKVVLIGKEYDTKPYLPGEANRSLQYSDM